VQITFFIKRREKVVVQVHAVTLQFEQANMKRKGEKEKERYDGFKNRTPRRRAREENWHASRS
jgi:hypothetical protein